MKDQPNIILILTDHFRPDALGPSTPNLMSQAERGVQFGNAYCASPLCQQAGYYTAPGTRQRKLGNAVKRDEKGIRL